MPTPKRSGKQSDILSEKKSDKIISSAALRNDGKGGSNKVSNVNLNEDTNEEDDLLPNFFANRRQSEGKQYSMGSQNPQKSSDQSHAEEVSSIRKREPEKNPENAKYPSSSTNVKESTHKTSIKREYDEIDDAKKNVPNHVPERVPITTRFLGVSEEAKREANNRKQAIDSRNLTPNNQTDSELHDSSKNIPIRSRTSSRANTPRVDGHKPWVFHGCSNVNLEYRILDKLGEGTFGEVHRGEKISNKYQVALKRIFLHNEKEGFPITALREIRILKTLDHPNIIPIVDMAVRRGERNRLQSAAQRGSVYMITPYMEHDLAGLLGNPGVVLELSHIKCYMYQLFQGMKYLHDQHYLHRDIKSANILIDNWGILRIADFGLARPYDEPPPRPGTGAGKPGREYTSMVVTRWYRAPELVLGESRYTTAVDMWGVGCVFSEMFRRHPILQGVSDADQAHCIFKLLGGPTQETMPGFERLPGGRTSFPYRRTLEERFNDLDPASLSLLSDLLKLDPQTRLTAVDALSHEFFRLAPKACHPEELPRYNDSHELDTRKARKEQRPAHPAGGPNNGPPPRQRERASGPPPGFLEGVMLPNGGPYGNGRNGPSHSNNDHSYSSHYNTHHQGPGAIDRYPPADRSGHGPYRQPHLSASMYDSPSEPGQRNKSRSNNGPLRDSRNGYGNRGGNGRERNGNNRAYPVPSGSQAPPLPTAQQPAPPTNRQPQTLGDNFERRNSFNNGMDSGKFNDRAPGPYGFPTANLPPRPNVNNGGDGKGRSMKHRNESFSSNDGNRSSGREEGN